MKFPALSTGQILATILGFSMLGISNASEHQSDLWPEFPIAVKGEQCVAPVEEMRRDHMTMLYHQRDRTMYQGERNTKFSLVGCIDCHTQKDSQGAFIPINAPGQFCAECHAYTSVKIDCFECHATKPEN